MTRRIPSAISALDLTPLPTPRASAWRILTSCAAWIVLPVLVGIRIRWYQMLANRARDKARRSLGRARFVEAGRWYRTESHYLKIVDKLSFEGKRNGS